MTVFGWPSGEEILFVLSFLLPTTCWWYTYPRQRSWIACSVRSKDLTLFSITTPKGGSTTDVAVLAYKIVKDPVLSLVCVICCLCPVLEVFPLRKISSVFMTRNWKRRWWDRWNHFFFLNICILLKYSWLIMFQVHSKVIQLYIYTYIIFEIIFHHRLLLQDIDYSSLCYT